MEDYRVVINPGLIACPGDFDLDLDVDAADLANYANGGSGGIDFGSLVASFGGPACP